MSSDYYGGIAGELADEAAATEQAWNEFPEPETLTAFLGARVNEDAAKTFWCPNDYDTDRMYREIAAKRARLTLALSATAELDRLRADATASDAERAVAVACAAVAIVAVKHDAAVYSNHPDYRSEWKH